MRPRSAETAGTAANGRHDGAEVSFGRGLPARALRSRCPALPGTRGAAEPGPPGPRDPCPSASAAYPETERPGVAPGLRPRLPERWRTRRSATSK